MEEFIARENIRRYRQQLVETSDSRERETLRQLLADEEARLAQLESRAKPSAKAAQVSG